MLAVILIIGILASVLFPSLNQVPSRARSARCKAQLRQLGISLRLYANETGFYPSTQMGELLREEPETWFTLLSPYILNRKITQGLFLTNIHQTEIFHCTEYFQSRSESRHIPNRAAYGYNVFGTELPDGDGDWITLGLGISLDRRFAFRPISESMVRDPAEMMAIGCMESSRWEMLPAPFTLNELGSLHSGGSNVVFCDGHVEFGKKTAWNARTDQTRRRWNRDHEPHAETWR